MKIKKLTLKNFKGIAEFTLDLQGKSASVFADNAAGRDPWATQGAGGSLFPGWGGGMTFEEIIQEFRSRYQSPNECIGAMAETIRQLREDIETAARKIKDLNDRLDEEDW